MFRILAVLALMFCAYLALITWAPLSFMVAGFLVAGHFICYWWCGLAVFGWLAARSI